jgi:hypothetical protein
MLGNKTFLQYIIDEEKQDFINENQITYNSIDKSLDLDTGAFLFETNSTSQAFKDLMSSAAKEEVASYERVNTGCYMDQLGTRLIKAEVNQPIRSLLRDVYDIKQKLGDSFAGVLFLVSKKCIINPLHPLVALELLNEPELNVQKLLVFTYDDLDKINSYYGQVKTDFTANISLLIKAYQTQIKNRSLRVVDNQFNESSETMTQNYQISKFPGEDTQKEHFIVAHQLLTRGTFVPYYGTSVISMNGNTSGTHISPFKSANISNHGGTGGASVCTGSTSNKTLKGLRTLHHSNLSSPYESSCMTNASKPYADACIEYSFNIFKQAKLIKEETQDEQETSE